jgi:iron-sulfur cluster repair protein YtfE (RIC family)
MSDKISKAHSSKNSKLIKLKNFLTQTFEKLNTHLIKEEKILFPTIEKM